MATQIAVIRIVEVDQTSETPIVALVQIVVTRIVEMVQTAVSPILVPT